MSNDNNQSTWYGIIKTFIRDLGFPIAVALYFLAKDYFFTEKLITLQTKIALALDQIANKLQ